MKKMILMLTAGVAFAATSLAVPSTDVLMWYLDLGDSPETGIQNQTFDTLNFYLRSTEDGSTINLTPYTYLNQDDVGTGQGSGTADGINGNFAGVYHTDLSGAGDIDFGQYEFMLALYYGGSLVAWSETLFNGEPEPVLLSTLQSANALYARATGGDLNPSEITAGTPFNFGPHVVPEPTGGLLMLVGGALLALRRKRKNV